MDTRFQRREFEIRSYGPPRISPFRGVRERPPEKGFKIAILGHGISGLLRPSYNDPTSPPPHPPRLTKPFIIPFLDKASMQMQQLFLLARVMILLVLVFLVNFIFTWVIPIAYVCACGCIVLAVVLCLRR